MRRIVVILLVSTFATAQNVPAALTRALDQWKSAVTTGDTAAIQSLYSSYPPAHVISADGKQQLPVSDETSFWQKMKASGMQDLQVQVRGANEQQGAQIVNLLLSFRTHTPHGPRSRYVIEQQAWVSQLGSWHMAASTHTDILKIRPPEKLNPNLYPPPSTANEEISDAVRKANTSGKRVLVVFGGNWCYDCHVLDAAMHEPDLQPVVDHNFVVVHVNIGDDGKQNGTLATKYGIPIEKGVPAIAVLGRNGTLLYSDKHAEFEKARSMDPDDIAAFLNKWKPGPAR